MNVFPGSRRARAFLGVSMPLAMLLVVVETGTRAQAPAGSGVDLAALDRRVDPCTDFFQYTCGGWQAAHEIPPDQSRWGRFNELIERNQTMLRGIAEQAAENRAGRNPIEQKIGDYYAACMDEPTLDARGMSPIKPLLDRVDALTDKGQLPELVGSLHRVGATVFFGIAAEQDYKNTTEVIASIDQGGLGLPDRDYYLKDDDHSKELLAAYRTHVEKMLALAGAAPEAARRQADSVLAVETALARVSLDRVSRRDPNRLYNKRTRAELVASTPVFAWEIYLTTIGLPSLQAFIVNVPDFLTGMNALIDGSDLDRLKDYLRWQVLHDNATVLSKAFLDENFEFYGKALTGAKQNRPRWKRCVDYTDADLGELLGQPYVEATFGELGKRRMAQMVDGLTTALRDDIGTLSWMTDATRRQALTKLGAMRNKIGYPETWRDYSALSIVRGDLVGNSHRANEFEFRRQMAKIGRPVERGEWLMTPPTVNAYYYPLTNDINFPAGILQPPFFMREGDDAVNYGAIGSVIGHEMTHGFDDQGRQFDAQGNLKDWWSEQDGQQFERRASCFVEQYGAYTAVDDVKLNGKLTLGENVADNGGLRIAYLALMQALEGRPRATLDGFTPEQRFFVGYGQSWCERARPEMARMLAQVDPHSPGRYRANGAVSNMPEFAKAFGCKADAPMVRGTMCRVW